MKKSRFKEGQIIKVLKEGEGGVKVADVSRKYGISEATYYNWRSKYGGMTESELKRYKKLEEEYNQLKRMYAELCIDHRVLKEIVEKKL